eukprot:323480-Pelagomonas_calceolata.AAC.1
MSICPSRATSRWCATRIPASSALLMVFVAYSLRSTAIGFYVQLQVLGGWTSVPSRKEGCPCLRALV